MIDRRTMMWDFIKTIVDSHPDIKGTTFVVCSSDAKAEELLLAARDAAHEIPSPIVNDTITFGKQVLSRCDKFFVHSGESRNSVFSHDVTGRSSPFVAFLMSETISLVDNKLKNPMYILLVSLKQDLLSSSEETYVAQQTWLIKCLSVEVISLYSANMLKYGVMSECLWIKHKMSKVLDKALESGGNYDSHYGTESDKK